MSSLASTIRKYQNLGLKVYITELDIAMDRVSGDESEKQKLQAGIYGAFFKTCINNGVRSISMYGENDDLSFYNNNPLGVSRKNANATIFDRSSNPKPAYFSIRQVLLGAISALPRASATAAVP